LGLKKGGHIFVSFPHGSTILSKELVQNHQGRTRS